MAFFVLRFGAYPAVTCREAGYTLDWSPVHHRATQRHITRKPEYPERTHAYTEKTCKLHTERPQLGIEPGTLSL